MTTFWRKIVRGQRGQALVETAIAVPLLLLLVLGIIDFGKAYNYQNDLTHLANEAARYATVNACVPTGSPPCTAIETAVKNDADTGELRNGGGSIAGTGVKIEICRPGPHQIEAKATARYTFLPFVLHTFTKSMSASATMYLEQDPTAPGAPPANYTVVPC